jgi:dipeptidyl aminopeptidase/acylaminoacyl peptidase
LTKVGHKHIRNHRSIALIFGLLLASVPACGGSNVSDSLPIAYTGNSHDVRLLYSNGTSRDVTTGEGVIWTPDHTELLVQRVKYINPPSSEIWLVSTSGNDIRQVTFVYPDQVRFFAAGEYGSTQFMAYDTGKSGVQLLNLRTGAQQAILTNLGAGSLAISPDGARVAFTGGPGDDRMLYVAGTYTRSPLKAVLPVSDYRDIFTPSWSPDGQWIAFALRPLSSEEAPTAVWLVHPDGTDLHKLTLGDNPQWSPDGQWISFVSQSQRIVGGMYHINNALFKIHPDGTDRTQLTPYIYNSAPSSVNDFGEMSW